jgi:tetratricopeptide (TPR) repeat protein
VVALVPVTVRVGERGQNPDGSFQVRVSFGESAEYDVTVTDPADQQAEERLAWYFEKHLRYPFLDKDLEAAAVGQIGDYGRALFAQVFGGAANHDYRRLRDRAFDGCRIEVSGSAGLHRLHWEAMRDPDLPVPLAVRLPVTRRVDALGSRFDPPEPMPTVNILVVVARPDGAGDVGYRTVSRPLLAALRTAGVPVTVDLVRPGTWGALVEHLRAATERHGSGWYQVIHFDLHGAFSHYAPLEEARRQDRLLFAAGALAPFAGRRGFLFFETEQEGKAGPVAAEEVASLLAEHRVPVAVLNACQSAMQDASEAGLAQRLAEAGVPTAVGMAYSVTVTAAAQAMPVLYGRIADGAELTAAVHAARRELFDRKARQGYFGQLLDLEDWMLPVMFAQRPLSLGLRPMTGKEQADFYEQAAALGDEPATEYGFVGRDLDIQAIEHRLLAGQESNQLLIQGMAGAGKSTLLAHLAWWWQHTGLVRQVFRFSYEDRAWTSAQIVREIRARLLPAAGHAQADAMSEQAQAEQVAALLRATRHLLIIDNAESITAAPAAIPHALTPAERDKLKGLLARVRGGRTLVLLGSREPETWLTATGTGPGSYPLPGLDPQAASTLVERILERHHAAGYLKDPAERGALQELITLLGGYPLPLTVVLPVLSVSPPSAVLAELKAGGPGADPAGLIGRAIEYSHGKLDPALQDSLLLLAPFTSVIPGRAMDIYRYLLLETAAVQELGPVDLPAALDQAVAVGLAAPHPQLDYLVQVQPVLPYFLRGRLHDRPALQAAASQAHYKLYYQLAKELGDMLRTPESPQHLATGQAATRAEYANLTTALAYGLSTGQPVDALIDALDTYLRQTQQHETRRQLLDDAIAAYPEPVSSFQQTELAFLHEFAGIAAVDQRRLDGARTHEEAAIRLLEAAGNRKRQGALYHVLGIIAQEQRRWDEAEASYRKALDIFLEYGDQPRAAVTYGELGVLAQERRRWDEAEASYRKALDIKLEYGDQPRAAGTYHQLGVLAQEQGRWDEAKASYRKALGIFVEYGDQHSAAGSYHNLGAIAQKQRRWDEAEASYRKALDIYLEYGDQPRAAITYHQLGRLAQEQRRWDEAKASYRKALGIFVEYGDEHSAARTYHNLGMLAQEQRDWDEAEASYRKALDIYRESDRRTASRTATQLASVLAALDRHPEAADALLYAAVTWRQESGGWEQEDLRGLRRERTILGPDQFTARVTAGLPGDLAQELTTAMGAADEPDDTGDPGNRPTGSGTGDGELCASGCVVICECREPPSRAMTTSHVMSVAQPRRRLQARV